MCLHLDGVINRNELSLMHKKDISGNIHLSNLIKDYRSLIIFSIKRGGRSPE